MGGAPLDTVDFQQSVCVCVYATDIWMVQLPKGLEGLNNQ